MESLNTKILVVNSYGSRYALRLDLVAELLPVGAVSAMPGSANTVRGGVVVRNELIPLVDLRQIFGQPTLAEERASLIATLTQREQDHIDWLDELFASIREKRDFRKTTDPRRCAFGQWFYSFKTQDTVIERLLAQFEEPHSKIHAVAIEVTELMRQGKVEAALDRAERAKHQELSRLLTLFRELKGLLAETKREIAVVLQAEGRRTAIAVDRVEGIRPYPSDGSDSETNNVEGLHPALSRALTVKDGVVYMLRSEAVFSVASANVEERIERAAA